MKHASFLSLVLLVFGCSPEDPEADSLRGQSATIRIGNADPFCSECEVELREIALLGGPTDPASVSERAAGIDCTVGQLSTGEFAVSSIVGGGEIFIYGPDGRFVRAFGRSGEGPGELGDRVSLVVGPQDTLYVLDQMQARLSVFTTGGEFLRSIPIPNRVQSFAFLNNRELLFSRKPLGSEDGLFFLTSLDGEERGQFGKVSFNPPDLDDRIVGPAHPEGFWTASIWRYELQRWSAPDVLEISVKREVDWFPPDGEFVDGMPFTIPTVPTLKNIWDDGHGLIWTYAVVADAAWEPEIPLDPQHEWMRRNFDTVIEVIDLNEGQVMVSARHDQVFGMVCGGPLVYTVVEAEDGDTRLRIMEPRLVGPFEKDSSE